MNLTTDFHAGLAIRKGDVNSMATQAEQIFDLTGVAPDPGSPVIRVPAVESKETNTKI